MFCFKIYLLRSKVQKVKFFLFYCYTLVVIHLVKHETQKEVYKMIRMRN